MTTTHRAKVFPLTIEPDETHSRAVSASETSDAVLLGIQAPTELDGVPTRTLQTSQDGIVWTFLRDAGGAVALPGAAQSRTYHEMLPFAFWRINYSVAPDATEIWLLSKLWSVS